jgi:hypothetical protein
MGKKAYRTRLDALLALSRCDGSRNPKRHESRVYSWHGRWFLTSMPEQCIKASQKTAPNTVSYNKTK